MEQPKKNSSQVSYILRLIIGIYLLYIDYTLLRDWQRLDNKVLFAIFIAVFAIFGVLVIIMSAKNLIQDYHEKRSNEKNEDKRDV